jgi:type II secretory pathway component PulF
MPQYRYQARQRRDRCSRRAGRGQRRHRRGASCATRGTRALADTPVAGQHARSRGTRQNGQAALNYGSGPTQKDILDFTTQLAVMIRAGISIRAALEGIADQTENPKFRKILLAIKERRGVGQAVLRGDRRYPKLFSRCT